MAKSPAGTVNREMLVMGTNNPRVPSWGRYATRLGFSAPSNIHCNNHKLLIYWLLR